MMHQNASLKHASVRILSLHFSPLNRNQIVKCLEIPTTINYVVQFPCSCTCPQQQCHWNFLLYPLNLLKDWIIKLLATSRSKSRYSGLSLLLEIAWLWLQHARQPKALVLPFSKYLGRPVLFPYVCILSGPVFKCNVYCDSPTWNTNL